MKTTINPSNSSKRPKSGKRSMFLRRTYKFWIKYNRLKITIFTLSIFLGLYLIINTLINSNNFLPIDLTNNTIILNRVLIVTALITFAYVLIVFLFFIIIDWFIFLRKLRICSLLIFTALLVIFGILNFLAWILFIQAIINIYVFIGIVVIIFMLQFVICLKLRKPI